MPDEPTNKEILEWLSNDDYQCMAHNDLYDAQWNDRVRKAIRRRIERKVSREWVTPRDCFHCPYDGKCKFLSTECPIIEGPKVTEEEMSQKRPGKKTNEVHVSAYVLDELKAIKNLLILQLKTSGVSMTDIRSVLHIDMRRLRRLVKARK